jgi:glycosyltransferase involved in cell wall biosynthesis
MGVVPARVMFMFWGRRGSLTKIAHDVHAAALAMDDIEPTLSVSRQAENFAACAALGRVHAVDTFSHASGALTGAWRLPGLRGALGRRIEADRIEAVVNLMPHVWTPFMAPAVRQAGARFATIIHDASAHPGDRTALLNRFFAREARHADVVFTLSEAVRDRLIGEGGLPAKRVVTLFHPDLDYAGAGVPTRSSGGPLRLLFLGRIMRYKGLGLLVEALELLRGQGVAVELGIYGEGSLAPYEARLGALGATIVNRWLDDGEVGAAFAAHDSVVLSHIEASQSGVAAAAFGAGLPVIATPVGGLAEQVADGVNGVLAGEVSAPALAAAIARLAGDLQLLATLRGNIRARGADRSMERFVRAVVEAALPGRLR